MTKLIPIKVKIGLRPNGHADHPNWKQLQLVKDSGLGDDYKGGVGGWFYDKISGHQDDTPDSPIGMQWGMVLVYPELAAQALAEWPDKVYKLTENEAEDFYNNRAMIRLPENRINLDELVGLKTERDLRVDLKMDTTDIDAKILKAINPDDTTPGIVRNKTKTWAGFKEKSGITIKKI